MKREGISGDISTILKILVQKTKNVHFWASDEAKKKNETMLVFGIDNLKGKKIHKVFLQVPG